MRPLTSHPHLARAVAGAVAVALLAACSAAPGDDGLSGPDPAPTAPTTRTAEGPGAPGMPPIERYVAIGDSYTAAPYVPVTDLAGGCLRSDGNYPSLLAERLGADLVDVSCSGARSRDVLSPQRILDTRIVPQLDAVTPDADLVTVSLGGNDEDLFATLVGLCTRVASQDPDPGAAPCRAELAASGRDLDATLARTEDRLVRVLERVSDAAPDARVVLVGYPHIVPPTGPGCEALPLASGDLDLARRVVVDLDQAMARAADRAGVAYADVRAVTDGHDICAEDPWVNGAARDTARALEYHPFDAHQRAVADLLLELLEAPADDSR